jgi:hypothetical protein
VPPDPGVRAGAWYVLPIDQATGQLGEAIPIGKKDLSDTSLGRCTPGQDGWEFDTGLESTPNLDLGGTYASIDSTELRLRMDPGVACVGAIAVRIQGEFVKAIAPAGKGELAGEEIPLAATERGSGRRWSLRCRSRGGFFGRSGR